MATSPSKPKTLSDAVNRGTLKDELVAIRAVLARAIDAEGTSPRDLARLSKRRMRVSREIEAINLQLESQATTCKNGASDGAWAWRERLMGVE